MRYKMTKNDERYKMGNNDIWLTFLLFLNLKVPPLERFSVENKTSGQQEKKEDRATNNIDKEK